MRALGIVVVILCASGVMSPAHALEFCDKIKDTEKRLVCLQEHISHLEESLLGLSTQVTNLKNALKLKLDSDAVYKLKHVAQVECLGVSGAEKKLDLQSCDRPDSWKLVPGSQKPGKPEKKEKSKQ